MNDIQKPVLYILMRTDIKSMNPGKAMAQASHASNAFVKQVSENDKWQDFAKSWQEQTYQGFGTVLVLGVNHKEMVTAVNVANRMGYVSGIVNDPTYPYIVSNEEAGLIPHEHDTLDRIVNEDVTVLFRSEATCGYIFMDKNDDVGQYIVSDFDLHP